MTGHVPSVYSEGMTNTATTAPRTIDMNTAEGMAEWVKGLPTSNLKTIAAREVFYGPVSNVLMVTACQMELIMRGAA